MANFPDRWLPLLRWLAESSYPPYLKRLLFKTKPGELFLFLPAKPSWGTSNPPHLKLAESMAHGRPARMKIACTTVVGQSTILSLLKWTKPKLGKGKPSNLISLTYALPILLFLSISSSIFFSIPTRSASQTHLFL